MSLGVTLLGPDIDHRRSLESMLGQPHKVQWLPDSNSHLASRPADEVTRLDRLAHRAGRLIGTFDALYLRDTTEALARQCTDVVIAYWGTEPLADLLAIRRRMPHVKLVLMVLCYPVSLTRAGVARQDWMMRRIMRVLDGVIFPNEAMRDHFRAAGLLGARVDALILPPCWTGSFQSTGDQPPGLTQPNVIFTGRTDLSSATVHAADDLRVLMRALLDAGIELHHVRSRETDDGHPLRRPFQPMRQAELIRTMARHDASLIAYNTTACERDDRFRLTVPDRLISTVAAGVPVAVPQDGYEGAKQYLQGHPGVLCFRDAAHLRQMLDDRVRVAELRAQAWAERGLYAAERHAPRLQGFLSALRSS
ncbi:MAG: glycosyltransferase [Aquabacterium commune]|uniref:glycosyltransferase n=1 Tax=Aquabacterium commune TaxID=70586 RepID=UPI003BB1501F